jgi:tetratricopeptide (TPR) repeat protein
MHHAPRICSVLLGVALGIGALPDVASCAAPPAAEPQSDFEQAVRRVSSPYYSHFFADAARRRSIHEQIDLQSLILWRSGLVAPPAPRTALPLSAGGVVQSPRIGPGSANLYSPYYLGPFEPTPFWPGYIWGYPYLPTIEQPIGQKITPQDDDIANGYVSEPVYAGRLNQALEAFVAQRQQTSAAAQSAADFRRFAELDNLDASLEPASDSFREGNYQMAIAHLIRLPDEVRESPRAELLRAYALFGLSNYRAAALAQARALLQLSPAAWQPEANRAAQRFGDRDRYDQLVRQLEAYVRAEPDDAASRFVLGAHYGFRGFPRDAMRQLEFARQLDIDQPDRQGQSNDSLAGELYGFFRSRLPQKPQIQPVANPQAF